MTTVLCYGGGRQTIAICVLIARGVLPKPDRVVMADTARENRSTWDYLEQHAAPYLQAIGLEVEIAKHDLATVDLYDKHGLTLMPVFTATGKTRSYCSVEWKKRVIDRHLRNGGVRTGDRWLGYAFDERRRWIGKHGVLEKGWRVICPLVDLMMNTETCLRLIESEGLPEPQHSSCYMCPHKRNSEWRAIRNDPEQWAKAIQIDEEVREQDEKHGVWLHHDRVPLAEANIDVDESEGKVQQCTLGMCFV